MTDLLTQQLRSTTERLPIALRSAETVRGDAQRHARRRLGAVAVTAALTVVVVIGLSAGLAGERNAAPPPAENPTPTMARVTIGLDRFLTPRDLPTSAPFGAWTTAATSRDMVGQPYCLSMSNGEPVGSRLVEFGSETAGLLGYQLVAAYATVTQARDATVAALDDLDRCTRRLGRTQTIVEQSQRPGEHGLHVLRSETPTTSTEMTLYGRSGRLVSVAWLTGADPAPVVAGVADEVLDRMLDRVSGAIPDEPPADRSAELAAALLRADDIAGGSARQDDVSEQFDEDPTAFRPLHLCDQTIRTGSMRHRTFSGADGQQVAGQRVEIGIDAEGAANSYGSLVEDIERCDGEPTHNVDIVQTRVGLDVGDLGGDTVAWRYRLTTADKTAPLLSYVAVVRLGSVVTEVVLQGREEAGLDPGAAALVRTTEAALSRIRAALPSESATGTAGGTGGVRIDVPSHCGVLSVTVDGVLWLADPALGDHNPPPGWDENQTSGSFVVMGTRAEFRGDGGQQAMFRRALAGTPDPLASCE